MAFPIFQSVFVALGTQDLARSVGFYQALWQREPVIYDRDRYGEFHLPGMRLALFQPQPSQAPEFCAPTSGAMSLCLTVAAEADLVAAIAQLTTLGYPPPGPIQTSRHGQEVHGYDPDGNRLIFYYRFKVLPI